MLCLHLNETPLYEPLEDYQYVGVDHEELEAKFAKANPCVQDWILMNKLWWWQTEQLFCHFVVQTSQCQQLQSAELERDQLALVDLQLDLVAGSLLIAVER